MLLAHSLTVFGYFFLFPHRCFWKHEFSYLALYDQFLYFPFSLATIWGGMSIVIIKGTKFASVSVLSSWNVYTRLTFLVIWQSLSHINALPTFLVLYLESNNWIDRSQCPPFLFLAWTYQCGLVILVLAMAGVLSLSLPWHIFIFLDPFTFKYRSL